MWFDKFFTLEQKLDELTLWFVLFFLSFFIYFFRFMISEFCCISLELFVVVVVMFLLNNCTLIFYYYFFCWTNSTFTNFFSWERRQTRFVAVAVVVSDDGSFICVILHIYQPNKFCYVSCCCWLFLITVSRLTFSFKWFFFLILKTEMHFFNFLQNFHLFADFLIFGKIFIKFSLK